MVIKGSLATCYKVLIRTYFLGKFYVLSDYVITIGIVFQVTIPNFKINVYWKFFDHEQLKIPSQLLKGVNRLSDNVIRNEKRWCTQTRSRLKEVR